MLIVKEIKRICLAAPSSWEGVDEKGKPVYIRYRHGELTVRVGDNHNGIVVFENQLTYEDDSYMSFAELETATNGEVLFVEPEIKGFDE